MPILFRINTVGEIDEFLSEFKFQGVIVLFLVIGLIPMSLLAQAGSESSSLGLSDLPSTDGKSKIPALEEPAPSPDLGGMQPQESPSIPQLRPPEKEADKAKDQDWAAQAMLQKKDEAKKKEQEQAVLADQKARESQLALEKEKKEKEEKIRSSSQPAVSKSAAPGLAVSENQKLPAVTGLEGVKPRAVASGDGRVQPGFDGFTGPSSTSPLGGDFQSGAKPIMPGTSTTDGRIQVPAKAPEVPSGGYKRISQDPYSMPPSLADKKTTAPPAPKPVTIPPNPTSGDPKRAIEESKAGYSPYDNTRKVPDPRSQRRF